MKQVTGFVLLLLLLECVALRAYACSCRPPSPEIAYEKSEAVFVGEFISHSTALFRGNRVSARRFKVKKRWKGDLAGTINLPYSDNPGFCGDLELTKGQEYLIYASSWKGDLIIDVDCSRNRNVNNASEDFKYLEGLSKYHDGPPNKGMHPTVDTTALMLRERLGAAGEARR